MAQQDTQMQAWRHTCYEIDSLSVNWRSIELYKNRVPLWSLWPLLSLQCVWQPGAEISHRHNVVPHCRVNARGEFLFWCVTREQFGPFPWLAGALMIKDHDMGWITNSLGLLLVSFWFLVTSWFCQPCIYSGFFHYRLSLLPYRYLW